MVFLSPEDGKIKIDDKLIDKNILHNYFSYVPQDPFILDENIFTNISFSTLTMIKLTKKEFLMFLRRLNYSINLMVNFMNH